MAIPQLVNQLDIAPLVEKIKNAKSIILTTHKQCDGDGLGAILGLYYALKKSGKNVRAISVDEVPKKYSFLNHQASLDIFEKPHTPIEPTDLVLIFDTNDKRLVEPLFSELMNKSDEVLFVDHHPVLNQGPPPTEGSFIDTRAASTGEIAYFLIKELGISFDAQIARALYTSVSFDTQVFRYIKNSATSHLIAADLLQYEKEPQEIHRFLFATQTEGKMKLLSKALGCIEYVNDMKIATLVLEQKDFRENNLDIDDSRDIIDMIMNVQQVQIAALFFEMGKDEYKVSLRSKNNFKVLSAAESFGGGGHDHAAGAYLYGSIKDLQAQVIEQLSLAIK